jgi:hypothetical protein
MIGIACMHRRQRVELHLVAFQRLHAAHHFIELRLAALIHR